MSTRSSTQVTVLITISASYPQGSGPARDRAIARYRLPSTEGEARGGPPTDNQAGCAGGDREDEEGVATGGNCRASSIRPIGRSPAVA